MQEKNPEFRNYKATLVREQELEVEFSAPADTDFGTLEGIASDAAVGEWFEALTTEEYAVSFVELKEEN